MIEVDDEGRHHRSRISSIFVLTDSKLRSEIEEMMREAEEGSSWFPRWDEQLLNPDELIPLSQSLITRDLADAFGIPTSPHALPPPPPAAAGGLHHEYDGNEVGVDEPARTLKRPRLVWTPQLHKRFVDAVAHLGIKNAVPKTIMQLMSVDGLTRENVASHLQKYRLYLKRMQGLSGSSSASAAAASAEDQLFATGPLPQHFLSRGGGGPPDPFVPMSALQQHQITAAVVHQQQFYHQRLGSAPGSGGGYDHHGFLSRTVPQLGIQRIVGNTTSGTVQTPPPPGDLESGTGRGSERKILTLFPTGDD